MRIPTAEELAAAAPDRIRRIAARVHPTAAPTAARFLRTGAGLARSSSAVPLLQAGSGLPVPPPPPAFSEPEVAAVEPPASPFDVEPAIEVEPPPPPLSSSRNRFVPPVPPPPPAFYEPEPASCRRPPAAPGVLRPSRPLSSPHSPSSSGFLRARGGTSRRAGRSVRTRVRAGARALPRGDGKPRADPARSDPAGAFRDRSGTRGRARPG